MTRIIPSRENDYEDESTKQLLDYIEEKISQQYRYMMAHFEDKFKKKFEGKLTFSRFRGTYMGMANYHREEIAISLPAVLDREHIDLLIHELAHFITHDQGYTGEFVANPHSFMFGILCAVLRRDLLGQKKHFFEPYDFSEDIYYEKLVFSPYEYDRRIMGLRYKDFEDMLVVCNEFAKELHQQIYELEHIKLIPKCGTLTEYWKQE